MSLILYELSRNYQLATDVSEKVNERETETGGEGKTKTWIVREVDRGQTEDRVREKEKEREEEREREREKER